MKKMLLKNWFWAVILLVIGLQYSFSQGLQPVKKYHIPKTVLVKETEVYMVESIKDRIYIIYNKQRYPRNRRYYIDYQDYQDIIEFFYELVKAPVTERNYSYEAKADAWSIEVKKTLNSYNKKIEYSGTLSTLNHPKLTIFNEDVEFLSSLPLDIWE